MRVRSTFLEEVSFSLSLFVLKRRRHHLGALASDLCLLTFFKRVQKQPKETGHIPIFGVLQLEFGLSRYQLWQLITNFFFFGALGLVRLPMFFLARPCECSRKGRFEEIGGFLLDARVRGEFADDDRTVRERAVFRAV